MHDRNIHFFFQSVLNIKTVRSFYVFKINPTKTRTQMFHNIDKRLWILSIYTYINCFYPSKLIIRVDKILCQRPFFLLKKVISLSFLKSSLGFEAVLTSPIYISSLSLPVLQARSVPVGIPVGTKRAL